MSEEIVPGALVTHHAFDDLGVIMRIENGVARVLFDDSGAIDIADISTLTRVKLEYRVRRVSSGQVGVKLDLVSHSPPIWKVLLGDLDDLPVEIHEGDLRPDVSIDPYERAVNGELPSDITKTLITTATHYLRNEHTNNDLVSLDGARVDLKPHQVSVVHRVVSNRPHRYLLCDEVGLGKTIEAAMVIKELRARGDAQRVLIIVPANLTRQWQFELKSKFNEVFSILNTNTLKVLANEGRDENPFSRYDSVIVSKDWISNEERKKLVTQAAWDLVIVDEAHHARRHASGKKTLLFGVVTDLTDIVTYPDRSVLFLTATPMQLSSHELYSLVEMIHPTLFPNEEAFNGHRNALPQLNELGAIIEKADDLTKVSDKTVNLLSDWLGITREDAIQRLAAGDREGILKELSKKHLLTEVLIRNRKVKVLNFKERQAHRWDVELTPEEKAVVDAIEDYVESGYRNARSTGQNSIGLLMTTYQKMTASSLRTIRNSLEGRKNRLQGSSGNDHQLDEDLKPLMEDLDLDPDETPIADASVVATSNRSEVEELKKLIAMLDSIKIDSKARALIDNMEHLAMAKVPKVLIFTEYRGTQNYLADLLRDAGWSVHLFHGNQSTQQKDNSVEAFRNGIGRQVLIATEAGAEGRNFQFCHMLINYDLPWNPMIVEQRIGRIDRIGQENTVMVFNFCVKDSIEERVLDVLERRIKMFEVTVGGLDPILGDVAGDLRAIMQKAREDRPAAIEKLGERLEIEVHEARKADERLQDLFMDTKSYSVEIAARIKGKRSAIDAAAQEEYMKKLFAVHGTYITRDDDLNEYAVTFHDPFVSRHPELFRHPDEIRRRVVFRSDERPDSDYVQYMAFGHPVVEAAIKDVTQPKWVGSVGARRLHTDDVFKPVTGWLLLYQIDITDVRLNTMLLPVFVDDNGVCDVGIGQKLVERTMSPQSEESLEIDAGAREKLKAAKVMADSVKDQIVNETTQQLLDTAREKVDREILRLNLFYENLMENCNIKIAAAEDLIRRVEEQEDESQRRIIPVWKKRIDDTKNRMQELEMQKSRRATQINALRNPSCSPRLVQVVRVEVVDR